MIPTLKPCPFCQATQEDGDYRVHEDGWSVCCEECGASAKHAPTWKDAVIAWNTRALKREAKAEPVAWKVRIPRGSDAYEIRFASIIEQLREMEAKWPLALIEPLYASPPAPESN